MKLFFLGNLPVINKRGLKSWVREASEASIEAEPYSRVATQLMAQYSRCCLPSLFVNGLLNVERRCISFHTIYAILSLTSYFI